MRPGRGRVHRRRHRGRQPGRPRHGPRATAASPCARPSSTTPCCTRSSTCGGRVVAVDAAGVVDLDALAGALDEAVSRRVGDGRQQRGRHDPAARRGRRGRARAGARRRAAHRRGAGVSVARRGRRVAAAPTSSPCQRPQVRRTRRASARSWCASGVALAAAACSAAARSASGAAAPRTSPAIVAMADGHARSPSTTRDRRRSARVAALRDRLVDGLVARGARRPSRPCRRDRKVAGIAHVCIDGVESEALLFLLDGPASAPRPRRRAQRRDGAVPRAGGHGRAASAGARGSLRLSLGWPRPQTPTSTAPSRSSRAAVARLRRPSSALTSAIAVKVLVAMSRRGRLVGRRRAAARRGPRGRRRHHEALGRRERHAAAARWPTSTTPGGSPSSSASTTTSSTSATTSTRTSSSPTSTAHAAGRTPNPCIECNRHLKFDRLLERAERSASTRVATGHHARVVAPRTAAAGAWPAAPTGQGPELRAAHARPAGPRAGCCCRSAS